MHTLYISRALAADIKRNLPARRGGACRSASRTAPATPAPAAASVPTPHILLTTPESLALLTSYEDARAAPGLSG